MLLPHNIEVFGNLEQTLENDNCCCVVMGTGCGKTYVTLEYLEKYNLKALIVAPRNSICESWEKHTDKIETITYQKLANIYKDIDFTKYDIVICDEVHHIGAIKWGAPIKYLIDNNIKVIGLTESSIRYTDGGRDVAEEFFKGNVVFGESVPSAIEKKILNPVTYVGAMYNSDGLKKTLNGKIQSRLYAKLNLAINKTPTIKEILKKHMPAGKRKGIIFASTIEDINSAVDFVKSVYPNVEIKCVHSKQSEAYNNEAFDWFKKTDEGYLCSVDMISEGVHIKGVNTLIMLRRTESVNLFNQQLGRCLDASSKSPSILFDLVNNKYSIKLTGQKLRIKINSIFKSGKLNIIPSSQLIVNDYTKDIVDVLNEIKSSLEGYWTEEDDELLREFYKEHPDGKGIGKFAKTIFPNRTSFAIRSRIHKLGLNPRENKAEPYSDEELELIRKYYPIEGPECYVRFKNRSAVSITSKANNMGITVQKWTNEELNILKEYYPIEGKMIEKRLPNKTFSMIRTMANRMGIVSKAFWWTKEEDDLIKKYYAKYGAVKMEKMLPGRNRNTITYRAKFLGIQKEIKKIRCIETGQIFINAKEAAIGMGITSPHANSTILECCKGTRNITYGYHWEYVEEDKN